RHLALTNPGPQRSADGATVSLTVQADDADNDYLSFSATGLPSGLSIGSSTGAITGTLDSAAHEDSPYLVTVTVSDGTHSRSCQFLWQVTGVGVTNPGDQTTLEGSEVSLQISATTSGLGTLTYSASGLPDGLSIDPDTGEVSGTLAAGTVGTFAATVAASDG